ncbi:MAG: hypothetical protein ACYTGY_07045, partial [Planctomycetota bacterium]
GYRGDVFPSLGMWERSSTSVYASYPLPESLNVLRPGGSRVRSSRPEMVAMGGRWWRLLSRRQSGTRSGSL